LKADAVPEQFCPMCENGVPVARVGRIAFHIDAKHGSRRCLRASQNGGPSHG
jgi:hypothetical protein